MTPTRPNFANKTNMADEANVADKANGLDKFITAIEASVPNDDVEANKNDEPMAKETNMADKANVTKAVDTTEITVAD